MKLTSEHQQFRQVVRSIVENEINPHVDEWESAGIFPAHELFPKLAAVGALGLEYAPEVGGQGADHLFTLVLAEELGRADCAGVPMAIAVQTSMATPHSQSSVAPTCSSATLPRPCAARWSAQSQCRSPTPDPT